MKRRWMIGLLVCAGLFAALTLTCNAAVDLTGVLGGQDAANVTMDFLLPAKWDGVPVEWQSSDPQTLLVGGQKAYVVRQGRTKTVILSMKGENMDGGIQITVPGQDGIQTLLAEDFEQTKAGTLPETGFLPDSSIPSYSVSQYTSVMQENAQNRCLRLINESSANGIHAVVHAMFAPRYAGKLIMEYRFNARSGGYSNLWVSSNSSQAISNQGLFLRLPVKPGSLVLQGTESVSVSAPGNTWHTLKAELDISRKTAEVSLDGTNVAADFEACAGASSVTKMMFGYAQESVGELWIDDVRFSYDAYQTLYDLAETIEIPDIADDNLTLPVLLQNGTAQAEWFSSAPEVIHRDGTVTRQERDVQVELYVLLRDGAVRYVKEFSVTVPAEVSDDEAVRLDLEGLQFQTEPPLLYDLYLPKKGKNGSQISWQSSNGTVVHPVTGVVTPPASGIATVKLTARVSRGSAPEKQKTFSFSVPAPGAAGYEDHNRMTDAEFFGVWNNGRWVTEGKLDYARLELNQVMKAAQEGDYQKAKQEVLRYFQSRALRAEAPSARNALDAKVAAQGIHVFETSALGEIVLSQTEQQYQVDVTGYVKGGGNSFLLQALRRTPSGDGDEEIMRFSSRESGARSPRLVITYTDGTGKTLIPSGDTYIRGGEYASYHYGEETELLVSDGLGDSAARQGLLLFDAGQIGAKEKMKAVRLYLNGACETEGTSCIVFQGVENTWKEETVTWDTLPIRVCSWGNEAGEYDWSVHPGLHSQFYNVQIRLYHVSKLLAEKTPYYQDKAIRQYLDFIADNGGLEYDAYTKEKALNAGFRGMPHSISCFFGILESGLIDADGFTSLLKFMWQEPNALTYPENEWEAHNATAFQIEALTRYALYFPEFRDADNWKGRIAARMDQMADQMLYPDGGYIESTSGYDSSVLNTFSQLYTLCQAGGIPVSETFHSQFEKFARAEMFLTKPNGQQWDWGDGGGGNARGYIRNAADALGDQNELRFFASSGREGSVPAETSLLLPDAQLGVMRNHWGTDGVSGFFIGRTGGGHGHAHANHLGIFAYGRYLLTDTGMGSYDSRYPWFQWQSGRSVSHNTVEVDRAGQKKSPGLASIQMYSNREADTVVGISEAYAQASHQRTVLFLKERAAFLVTDLMRPKDQGVHTYQQAWHFLADANPSVNMGQNRVQTNFLSGANLSVTTASQTGMFLSLERGAALGGDGSVAKTIQEADFAVYTQEKTGEAVFQTVLLPMQQGQRGEVSVRTLPVSADGAAAAEVIFPDSLPAIYAVQPGQGYLAFGDYTTDAQLFYREESLLTATGVTEIRCQDGILLHTDKTLSDISIRSAGDKLDVTSSGQIEYLCLGGVYAQARQITVNGRNTDFVQTEEGIVLGSGGDIVSGPAEIIKEEGTWQISLPVSNRTAKAAAVSLTAAVKDENYHFDRLEQAKTVLDAGQSVSLTVQIKAPADGQTLELFLWDDKTQQPYMTKRTY